MRSSSGVTLSRQGISRARGSANGTISWVSILFESTKQFGMTVEADYKPEGLGLFARIALEEIEPLAAHLVRSKGPLVQSLDL